MCVIGKKFYSLTGTSIEEDGPHQVDLAVFPLISTAQRLSEEHTGNLKVFSGPYKDMMGRKVKKNGYATEETYGKVIDVNVGMRLDGEFYAGGFVVVTCDGNEACFAAEGDGGAVVFDESSNEALGIVISLQENYSNKGITYKQATFCTRLSSSLQYAEKKLKKKFGYCLEGFDTSVKMQDVLQRNDDSQKTLQDHFGDLNLEKVSPNGSDIESSRMPPNGSDIIKPDKESQKSQDDSDVLPKDTDLDTKEKSERKKNKPKPGTLLIFI